MFTISKIDHLVLTVNNIPVTLEFYARVLGMQAIQFQATDDSTRTALTFGTQKINLHQAGEAFKPHADKATPGSADLCLITETPLEDVIRYLDSCEVAIETGPVERSGATGALLSVYIRDPDRNLIEIANQR